MVLDSFGLILVSILWGATNPMIRRGSEGVDQIKAANPVSQFFKEILYLFTRWQYLIPFGLNQCGSLLYVVILHTAELSLVVPVVNSLTMVFTAISAVFLGEQRASQKTYMGMCLVMLGTAICIWDKRAREVSLNT